MIIASELKNITYLADTSNKLLKNVAKNKAHEMGVSPCTRFDILPTDDDFITLHTYRSYDIKMMFM